MDIQRHSPAELPHAAHFEYLRGVTSRKTAELFARSFAERNHATNLSWYLAYPYAEGLVVEIHEGGTGRALWPTLLELMHRSATAPASEEPRAAAPDTVVAGVLETNSARKIAVELTSWGITTMVLPEGIDESLPIIPLSHTAAPLHLRGLIPPYAKYSLTLGWMMAGTALVALLTAIMTKPHPGVIEYAATPASLQTAQDYLGKNGKGWTGLSFSDGAWSGSAPEAPTTQSTKAKGASHAK